MTLEELAARLERLEGEVATLRNAVLGVIEHAEALGAAAGPDPLESSHQDFVARIRARARRPQRKE